MPWGSRGGYPARSSRGGVPWPGGYPGWGVPWRGVPWPGGYPGGGVPCLGGVPWPGEGTQLGQHREYLLHGGRYASCVHAGGLSCCLLDLVLRTQLETTRDKYTRTSLLIEKQQIRESSSTFFVNRNRLNLSKPKQHKNVTSLTFCVLDTFYKL